MGSLFTSLGKITSLKTFLILTSLILYLDIYYIMVLKTELLKDYAYLLRVDIIIKLVFVYLALVTVIIPLFSIFIAFFLSITFQDTNVFLDNEYFSLEEIKEKSINENNYALIKIYLDKNEQYKEKQEVYKYSFFIITIIMYAFYNGIHIDTLIIIELLNFLNLITTDDNKLTYLFFLGIPFTLLVYFSFKYIISIEVKLTRWINLQKNPLV